ncbi:MAG: type I-C CRISPR-associated protein Cas7/Csd2 [Desulfomicrobium sp.]|nr:type I-C CRISPR-associated protein Cas7/Csd2 [Desulfomicrobium sp.]
MGIIENRYDFVLLFDVEYGNPNGDPDAGNMPRIDPETGYGLVTDVCLKRKVRNYVELSKSGQVGFNIYVREKAILNDQHRMAYRACDLEPQCKKPPKSGDDSRRLTEWMCSNFYDVRTFGAVMTTEVNCGQVRGPVQFTFARSVDAIVPQEVKIIRMAVTTSKEAESQHGDNKTMGSKFVIPYALYRMEGFVSPALAAKTGFSDEDAELLWEALINMFEHDRAAARGKMATRKLLIFKHDGKMGNAHAHVLFNAIKIKHAENGDTAPARAFSDYNVRIDRDLPTGVTLLEKA